MNESEDTPRATRVRRWRPRIRDVLVIANLVVLLLPLAGIAWLRLFENELLRRTESELYAQGAFVTAAYRDALYTELSGRNPGQTDVFAEYGRPIGDAFVEQAMPEDGLRFVPATLDRRRDPVLPAATDDAELPEAVPDPMAEAAGAYIQSMLLQAKLITLAGIRVVDFDGTEVANTRGEFGVSLLTWDEVPRALQGETVAFLRERRSDEPRPPLWSKSRRTRVRVFVAMPVIDGDRVLGAVVLSRTPVSLKRALYDNLWLLMGTFCVLVLTAIGLSWTLSVTIGRPLVRLAREAERIERGGSFRRAVVERPITQEVAALAEAVAAMAEALERRANAIRSFATSVSHEFKTPLSSLRGAVELLQDHAMSEDERDHFLGVLDKESQRLERLVRRLLDLARADVERPVAFATDVRAVVEDALRELGPRCPETEAPADLEDVGLTTMPGDALESIITCLLTNARVHGLGRGGTQITVSLRRAPEPGDGSTDERSREARAPAHGALIEVVDDGPGVSTANVARIFDPFFTTARDEGGTGVGLAIVRTLAAAHGGRAWYAREAEHSCFRVWLPTAPGDGARPAPPLTTRS